MIREPLVHFRGRIVMIGFGSTGQGTLPLLLRLFGGALDQELVVAGIQGLVVDRPGAPGAGQTTIPGQAGEVEDHPGQEGDADQGHHGPRELAEEVHRLIAMGRGSAERPKKRPKSKGDNA